MMTRCAALVLLTMMPLASRAASAEVIDLIAVSDNTIYEDPAGALSNGAGSYLFAGTTNINRVRRGLIAFDLAAVPSGAVVQSAALTLHMSRTATAVEPVALHRALSQWGEGDSVAFGEEGGGAPSAPGDATWLHRTFDTALWESAGGDFTLTESAAIPVGGNGFYTWGSTPALVADVRLWLDSPGSNFGWLLLGNESTDTTAKRFATHEHADASLRPALRIEYTAIPAPPAAILLIAVLGVSARRRSRYARPASHPAGATAPSSFLRK